MVQLMNKVGMKLEVDESLELEDQLGPLHKRSKQDPSLHLQVSIFFPFCFLTLSQQPNGALPFLFCMSPLSSKASVFVFAFIFIFGGRVNCVPFDNYWS